MLKFLIAAMIILISAAQVHAEKILFIPHDNRPVSFQQPAEVVSQLGYEIISPPIEILTAPDDLWTWLEENSLSANAAVISSDALLYGGLIPSRSHQISAVDIQARLENFKTLREKNHGLKIYVFCSLMRTPQFGTPGDIEEPDYYGEFGSDIFQLTRLLDKQEISKLSGKEKFYLDTLHKKIPSEILNDYFARREKNLAATKKILDFANDDIINYFIIGRDDNSPLSQTHRENRQLLAHMKDIPKIKAQSHAGIDEYPMLLLTRAVNDLRGSIPFVHIEFNRGVGAKTIPHYSDEELGNSIRDEILIAGAMSVPDSNRADFLLMINTDPKGNTFEIHNSFPPKILTKREEKYFRRNAKNFAAQIDEAVNKNLPVGVADVICANGSDNFLMNELSDKNLLFKLQSYAGWNTATNTTGFALSMGILAKNMSRASKNKLLARRYLDDWAYQANIRTQIAAELYARTDGLQIYLNLGEYESEIVQRENYLMKNFAEKNLKPWTNFTLSNPWHRLFECRLDFAE